MLFSRLAEYFERLEETSGRKELVALLARLVAELAPDEVGPVVYLCQGRLAPFYEPLEIGMGERSVAAAIARATETEPAEVDGEYARLGDLGLVAEVLLGRGARAAPARPLAVGDVYERLHRIAACSGPGSAERKLALLVELLGRVEPRSARYLCRIPLGRLRLGIGDPTILDALSRARTGTAADRGELERAYNLTSDLGTLARRYVAGGAEAVRGTAVEVGKPIRPALAERLPSVEAVVARLGRCAAEPKFDGLRCQVHKASADVRVFSRNLEDMTPMFPELVAGVRAQVRATTAILDGEAVAYDPAAERYRPFRAPRARSDRTGRGPVGAHASSCAFALALTGRAGRPRSRRRRRGGSPRSRS